MKCIVCCMWIFGLVIVTIGQVAVYYKAWGVVADAGLGLLGILIALVSALIVERE